ncbi:MAG: hypothetical protein U5K54_22085 [Cytophagales bacterium]|nr:hypothetical protein [Cytophagales bacterium]
MNDTKVKPQNKGTKQLFEQPHSRKLSRTHISDTVNYFLFLRMWTLLYWNIQNTTLTPLDYYRAFYLWSD